VLRGSPSRSPPDPGADLRIFEHSNHQILVDEPQAFIDLLRGFLVYN
jgi:proline iminopeptidase